MCVQSYMDSSHVCGITHGHLTRVCNCTRTTSCVCKRTWTAHTRVQLHMDSRMVVQLHTCSHTRVQPHIYCLMCVQMHTDSHTCVQPHMDSSHTCATAQRQLTRVCNHTWTAHTRVQPHMDSPCVCNRTWTAHTRVQSHIDSLMCVQLHMNNSHACATAREQLTRVCNHTWTATHTCATTHGQLTRACNPTAAPHPPPPHNRTRMSGTRVCKTTHRSENAAAPPGRL